MSAGMKRDILYPLQEAVLTRLQAMGDQQLSVAKLCGDSPVAMLA
jgi:hypothetical protein